MAEEEQDFKHKQNVLHSRLPQGHMAIFYLGKDRFSILDNTGFMQIYHLVALDPIVDEHLSDNPAKVSNPSDK